MKSSSEVREVSFRVECRPKNGRLCRGCIVVPVTVIRVYAAGRYRDQYRYFQLCVPTVGSWILPPTCYQRSKIFDAVSFPRTPVLVIPVPVQPNKKL
jgi:hypothetical protein